MKRLLSIDLPPCAINTLTVDLSILALSSPVSSYLRCIETTRTTRLYRSHLVFKFREQAPHPTGPSILIHFLVDNPEMDDPKGFKVHFLTFSELSSRGTSKQKITLRYRPPPDYSSSACELCNEKGWSTPQGSTPH